MHLEEVGARECLSAEFGGLCQLGEQDRNVTTPLVVDIDMAATAQESNKAAEIARGVEGVKAVENDIRVQ